MSMEHGANEAEEQFGYPKRITLKNGSVLEVGSRDEEVRARQEENENNS